MSYLEKVITKLNQCESNEINIKHIECIFDGKIPTLKSGVYRQVSPMLLERFEKYGRWMNATHGIWLTPKDMEKMWDDENDLEEDLIERIKLQIKGLATEWANHTLGLFKKERMSLFAGSDLNNETIILLWLDFTEEPEVFISDYNGVARYKNFDSYLKAYLEEDLSAFDKFWLDWD